MKRLSGLLVLAAVAAGCDGAPRSGPTPQSTPTRVTGLARHDWATGGCEGRPDRLPAIDGRNEAELVARFGAPASVERFAFGRSVGEFRVGLRNMLHMPEDAEVVVTERTWATGKCRLTIWSIPRNGTGVAIDSLIWSTDLQF